MDGMNLGRVAWDGSIELIEVILGVLTGIALLVGFGVAVGIRG